MALELDWEDSTTGVTYDDAYALISNVRATKGANGSYTFVASINIYKDSTAKSNGKSPIATSSFTTVKSYSNNNTTYRNIVNEIYNDMKDVSPWDDATDV